MDNFFPKFTNLRSESIIFAEQKFRALCRFGFVLRYSESIFSGGTVFWYGYCNINNDKWRNASSYILFWR